MRSAFATWLQQDLQPEPFVRQALRCLEGHFRASVLLALAAWERLDIAAPELYHEVVGLARPSWGRWNGLLTALRDARKAVLRDGEPAVRERVKEARLFHAVLDSFDAEPGPDLPQSLKPLARLVRVNPPRRPRLGQLLTWPITLRNDIAHFCPVDPSWWSQAAEALRPLVTFLAGHNLCPQEATPADYCVPWFLEGAEGPTFNGLTDKAALYVTAEGKPVEHPGLASLVLSTFQRLLGRQQAQAEALHRLAEMVPEELQGVLLGDFLLRGPPVGQGGYASVYAATQISTGRQVAIKVLHEGLSEEARTRFQQEGVLLSQFNHPNIVRVLGQGEEPWFGPHDPAVAAALNSQPWFREFSRCGPRRCFLALEWIEGHTLEQVYQGERPRPDVRTLADWFAQAATGLSVVHAAGLIHRDLKPGNLMATDQGQVVLMDFGIARAQDELHTLHTTPGRALGTPAYMSPEQISSRNPETEVGPASDVYSLCASFYELFTGTRLFHHDKQTEQDVTTQKLSQPQPERPRGRARNLPWEIDTILIGGLEREPVDRYRSVKDLERDLRHFLADQPIEYRRPSLLRRAQLLYRRQRTLVNLVTGFLILALAGLTVYIVSINAEQRRTARALSRAEHDLEVSLTAIDDVLEAFAEQDLYSIPQMGDLRRRLFEKALARYQQLLEQNDNDPRTRFFVARVRGKIGGVQISLGRYAEAQATLEQARDELRELLTLQPDNIDYRRALATLLASLAGAHTGQAQNEQVEELSRQLIEVWSELARNPGDLGDRNALAVAHDRLAQVLQVLGRTEEARQATNQALSVIRDVVKEMPEHNGYRLSLVDLLTNASQKARFRREYRLAEDLNQEALAALQEVKGVDAKFQKVVTLSTMNLLNQQGTILREQGRMKESESVVQQVIDTARQLVSDFPEEPGRRLDLGKAYSSLADLRMTTGRLREGEAAARDALKEMEWLCERYPDAPLYFQGLALVQNYLGELLIALARLQEAEEYFTRSQSLWSRIRAAHPQLAVVQQGWLQHQYILGRIHMLRGRRATAVELFQTIHRQLDELNASEPVLREQRGKVHLRQAQLAAALGLADQADKEARAALEVYRQLAADFPDVDSYQEDIADVHGELGKLAQKRQRYEQAVQEMTRAVELLQPLGKKYPAAALYQGELGALLATLAQAQANLGRLVEAEKSCLEALRVIGQFSKNFPDHTLASHQLAAGQACLGFICYRQGRLSEAETAYRHAIKLHRPLVEQRPADAALRDSLADSALNLCWLLYDRDKAAEVEPLAALALEHWRLLAREYPEHPDYPLRISQVLRARGLSLQELNRFSEAEASCREAVQMLEKLVAITPLPDVRMQQGLALKNLGFVLGKRRPADAEKPLRQSVAILDALAQEHPGQTNILTARAEALADLGRWCKEADRLEEAEKYQHEAQKIRLRLAEEFPTSTDHRGSLALSYYNLGLTFQAADRMKEAEEAYQKSLELRQDLAKRFSAVVSYRLDLAWSLNNLAWVRRSTDRAKQAEPLFLQALQIFNDLLKDSPAVFNYRQGQGQIYHNLALTYGDLGRGEEEEKHYALASKVRQKLVEDTPDLPGYRDELAWTLNSYAWMLHAAERSAEAEPLFRKAWQLRLDLVKEAPSVPGYRQALGQVGHNLALTLTGLNKKANAEQFYRTVLEMRSRLVEDFPARPSYRNDLAWTLDRLGWLCRSNDRLEEAEQWFRKTLEVRVALVKLANGVTVHRQNLATTYADLALTLQERGKNAEADRAYKAAIQTRQELADDFPAVAEHRVLLAQTLHDHANFCLDIRNNDAAETSFKRSRKLRQALLTAEPKNLTYRIDLGWSEQRLAWLLEQLDRPAEAERGYKAAIELREEVVRQANGGYRDDLGQSLYNLAALYLSEGKLKEATEPAQRALQLRRKVIEESPRDRWRRQAAAWSHTQMAGLHLRQNEPDKAVEQHRQALELRRQLAVDFPENTDCGYQLASTAYSLARLLRQQDKLPEADKLFTEAIGLQDKLATQMDQSPWNQAQLAHSLRARAELRLQQNQTDQAQADAERAVAKGKLAVWLEPKDENWREDLRRDHELLCRVYLKQRRPADVLRVLAEWLGDPAEKGEDHRRAAGLAAQCVPLAPEEQAAKYREQACVYLGEAVKRGYSNADDVEKATDFAPLKEEATFKAIVAELRAKQKKP